MTPADNHILKDSLDRFTVAAERSASAADRNTDELVRLQIQVNRAVVRLEHLEKDIEGAHGQPSLPVRMSVVEERVKGLSGQIKAIQSRIDWLLRLIFTSIVGCCVSLGKMILEWVRHT
jgi:hypothetical protein